MNSLEKMIVQRYSAEVKTENLSCGGNIDYAGIGPGEVVLDLGCGRGGETIRAAVMAAEGLAVGLDITPKMLETAKEQAKVQGVDNVQFLLGSFDRVPMADASVDAVISNCAINHVHDKEQVFREIYRVLKPGGRFVVSDVVSQEQLPESVSSDPEAVAACFGGAIPREEYFRAIGEAGFRRAELLKERSYLKNGFGLTSVTVRAYKL